MQVHTNLPPAGRDLTEVTVIRHGETVWNRQGRYQGQQDSALTPEGRTQAVRLGKRLGRLGRRYDAFYSSDLGRAWDTAGLAGRGLEMAPHPEPGLRERNFGLFEGLTRDQIREHHPDILERYYSGDADYRIPDGESLRGFSERVVHCVRQLAARHPGGRLLLVSHGGVLNMLFREAVGLDLLTPRRFSLHNASLNIFRFENEKIGIERWGDLDHLTPDSGDDSTPEISGI